MFTTGVHAWLYWATGCYFTAFILCCYHMQRTGRAALVAGFISHSLYLLGRGWLGDIFIPNAIFEGPFFLPWCLALISLVRSVKKPCKNMGGVLALVVVFSIFSIGWGNTFSWSARHLSSAVIWTFYAACLHLKFIPGWRKKAAVLTIAGAALVFFISFSNYIHEMSFLRVGG